MTEEKIARINELYKKAKTEGLTEEEAKEQHALRQEYLDNVRKNLKSQLNNIDIKEADGSITNLGEKYGNKNDVSYEHGEIVWMQLYAKPGVGRFAIIYCNISFCRKQNTSMHIVP